MACEVTLGSFRHALTTLRHISILQSSLCSQRTYPSDEDGFGKTAVGVFDLGICELDAAI